MGRRLASASTIARGPNVFRSLPSSCLLPACVIPAPRLVASQINASYNATLRVSINPTPAFLIQVSNPARPPQQSAVIAHPCDNTIEDAMTLRQSAVMAQPYVTVLRRMAVTL